MTSFSWKARKPFNSGLATQHMHLIMLAHVIWKIIFFTIRFHQVVETNIDLGIYPLCFIVYSCHIKSFCIWFEHIARTSQCLKGLLHAYNLNTCLHHLHICPHKTMEGCWYRICSARTQIVFENVPHKQNFFEWPITTTNETETFYYSREGLWDGLIKAKVKANVFVQLMPTIWLTFSSYIWHIFIN